jgi:hypothetical protein
MKRFLLLLVSALFLLTVVPSAAQSEANTPAALPLRADVLGMAIRDPYYEWGTAPGSPNAPNVVFQERMGAELQAMGVGWVRTEFHINLPLNAPADAVIAEIAKYDYFVNVVAPKYNLKILALLSFGLVPQNDPCDLNGVGDVPGTPFGGGVNTYMDAWMGRARLIINRYGNEQQSQIAAYQILNEHNRLLTCGTPARLSDNQTLLNAIAPEVMGRMMTKLFRFCRDIGPPPSDTQKFIGCRTTPLVTGGLHPRGSSRPREDRTTLTDAAYLQLMYNDPTSIAGFRQANNGLVPLDAIGYHPYPREIELSPNLQDTFVDRGVSRMREALTQVGDLCRTLWITEIGYNVGFDVDGPLGPRPVQTEFGQALFMRDVYTSLAGRKLPEVNCPSSTEIERIFWFKYEDFPALDGVSQQWGVATIPFDRTGKYSASGAPSSYRLAWWMYRELAGKPTYRLQMPFMQQ